MAVQFLALIVAVVLFLFVRERALYGRNQARNDSLRRPSDRRLP